MSRRVISVSPSANVSDAADLMANSNIKRLPIVDGSKLVGIVTMTDVLAHHEGSFDEEFILN